MSKQEIIQQKIYSWEELKLQLNIWRFKGKRIVFTNGCFDLIHLGHADYMARAADHGDILIIGLNTDDSVSRLKGENRPLLDEEARAFMLASLQVVTAVVLFDQDTPHELIRMVQPDVLIKGKDYNAEDVVGYDVVSAKGGEVITVDLVEGYSTTGLIEKIKKI